MLPSFKILQTIADACDVSVEDIKGRGRTKRVAQARHLVAYFLRKINGISYPAIGKIMGRDHTTVLHSYEKICNDVARGAKFGEFVEKISSSFGDYRKIDVADVSSLTKNEIEYLRQTLLDDEILKTHTLNLETSEDILNSFHNLEITQRDADILSRYRTGMTLEEISSIVGVTRERVRQIVMKTLMKELGQKAKEGFRIDVKEYMDSQKNLHTKTRFISKEKRAEIVSKIEAGLRLSDILKVHKISMVKFRELFPQYSGLGNLESVKKKRWSRMYDKCRQCGTMSTPHLRRGYCEVCSGSLRKELREKIIGEYGGKCTKCGISRAEAFRKYKRDLFLTRKLAGKSFAPLCRGCFLTLGGINMANKRWSLKKTKINSEGQ